MPMFIFFLNDVSHSTAQRLNEVDSIFSFYRWRNRLLRPLKYQIHILPNISSFDVLRHFSLHMCKQNATTHPRLLFESQSSVSGTAIPVCPPQYFLNQHSVIQGEPQSKPACPILSCKTISPVLKIASLSSSA